MSEKDAKERATEEIAQVVCPHSRDRATRKSKKVHPLACRSYKKFFVGKIHRLTQMTDNKRDRNKKPREAARGLRNR
jgi:hypothetical protein